MTTFIALLRGINVGGRNRVKMSDLRQMLIDLELSNATTLLQSGNVVFQTDEHCGQEVEQLLERELPKRLGVASTFAVRSASEWGQVVARNPFLAEAHADPSHLVVQFMKEEVNAAQVAAVQSQVKGPEVIRADGRQLYIYYADGIGTSKVGSTPGWNKLVAAGTGRNWSTVLKLADLCRQMG